MSSSTALRKSPVGELRPSQALLTFGVGALVDLPNLSVMVMGLEDWPIANSTEIGEDRLLASVQSAIGAQVKRLMSPPRVEETGRAPTNWFDDSNQIGVPVAPFPRWMVCSACRLLAPISSGLFEPKVFAYRPDKACYVHNCATKGKPPIVLPARFMAACKKGHLDDFPWLEFVHRGTSDCKGPLRLYEVGASGEAADVEVACGGCNARRRMAQAFGRDNVQNMPPCRGRRPHLRDFAADGCEEEHISPILQGASNSWFPIMISALSVPRAADRLAQLVADNWTILDKVQNAEMIRFARQIGQLREFTKYSDDEIWRAVEAKREGDDEADGEPEDLKTPEWQVFSNPDAAQEGRDFKLQSVDPPSEYVQFFENIVLVERLREVRALIGFTRIESPRDFDEPAEVPPEQRARLSRQPPTWVPAAETRGEGVFFQFSENAVQQWTRRASKYAGEFVAAHRAWRGARNLDPNLGFPGLRFILLHSFAHAIMRQLAVECGYVTASISERIYSRGPTDGDPMAGVLIYTAAPDSEGTLGGLCALGRPNRLGIHLNEALDAMSLCASDPLCAEHRPTGDGTLHGAACHACTFLPETSCERGNKYLDRAVLVPTVERSDIAFFERRV